MAARPVRAGLTLALVALLCSLPLLTGGLAQGDEPVLARPYERVHEDRGRIDLMDLSGDQLAWAVRTDAGLEIRLTDLRSLETRTVTEVPAPNRTLQVDGFAFDGHWIVWTDDRFGNLDVFAVDTHSDELTRVSDHPEDERQVDVDDGQAVWVRRDALYLADIQAGEIGLFQEGVGTLAEPSIDEGRIVWSQAAGASAFIVMAEIGETNGSAFPSARHEGSFGPTVDGQHAVWTVLRFSQDTSQRGVEGAMVRMADLDPDPDEDVPDDIAIANLTDEPGPVKDPSVGGGWAAWLVRPAGDVPFLHVEHLEHDASFNVPGPVSRGLLSETHLVVVRAEDGTAPIYTRSLEPEQAPEGGDVPVGLWVLAGLGAALVAAGLLWRGGSAEDGPP